ncbi:MAG TPA: arylsulfotransferase family protein [Solirubrobacteraceae bacterium]|nr:arylsulfotransferase family protein [Solirubrobacteraceae bacterium]
MDQLTSVALRRSLAGAGALVALASATTLTFASRRIVAEEAAFRSPPAARCVPTVLNRSDVLPGTALAVSPLPDSYDASPATQISLLGVPAQLLGGVRVTGSKTGAHRGRLIGYSQGDGASFVPARRFRPGETVTVQGRVADTHGTTPFRFHFTVAYEDPITTLAMAHAALSRDYNEMQHFHTLPNLLAPSLQVTARSPATAPGDMFAAPYGGPGPSGPMIFEESGNLVWFHPLAHGIESTNFQVQQDDGQPVLTWWQGVIPPQGFGEGEEIIANSSYQQIGRVLAGNGYRADLHEFHLTAQNTAVLTVFNPIYCNLSQWGGPQGAAVTDSVFQEVDLKTGLVRREWHSLDHVPLSASYSSAVTATREWPFDYFHLNSIDQLANGSTLISARNTWALYYLSTQTGQVTTSIGGRSSSVKLGPGAATAFQHDADVQPDGDITLFDNGGVPKVHPQSRGLVLSLNPTTRTDSVVSEYEHHGALLAGSQGNMQALPNGDVFVGWGSEPYFSEFSAGGQLLFDAHMQGTYQSYRTYRFPWTGTPPGPPSIAAQAAPAGGPLTVYASWNGDTRTTAWRLLAGPSPQQLQPSLTVARSGFETAIAAPAPAPYVAVQALGEGGVVLGTSKTIPG